MDGQRGIVLLAHPRSGSTSLLKILQLHPALSLLEEPFNEDFTSWSAAHPDYLGRVHDRSSLDMVLDEIFAHYGGLKVLDYQLPDTLLAHLLTARASHVVFLRRRNLLQTVVSNLIAVQTNLWKRWEATKPLAAYYRDLQPLDIADVQRRITELDAHLRWCEALLDAQPALPIFKLVYEELFFGTAVQRERWIAPIWPWLGLPPLASAQLAYYLDPAQVKLNGAETYQYLPNAAEIERECGSAATGWLFAAPAVSPA